MKIFKSSILAALALIASCAQGEVAELTVMVYNIQQLYRSFADWDQKARADKLPGAIIGLDKKIPDVIIVNEAFGGYAAEAMADLKDKYPYQTPVVGKFCSKWYNFHHSPAWFDEYSGSCSVNGWVINGGVMILSRCAIVKSGQYVYEASEPSTWDHWSNKGVACVGIVKNAKVFHVFGTHLQADESGISIDKTHEVRMDQLAVLRTWVNKTVGKDRSERVIIGGDPNVELNKTEHVNDMLGNLTASMHFEGDGRPIPGSFSAKSNKMAKANAKYYKFDLEYDDTLDYLMYPKNYAKPAVPPVTKVLQLNASKEWSWNYIGEYNDLSDHYPVVAKFVYNV